MDEIIYKLKKKYLLLILPIIIYVLSDSILFSIQKLNLKFEIGSSRIMIVLFLIGAALFDIILPMWNKIIFINKIKENKATKEIQNYFNYQKTLLYFSFTGAYLAIIAYVISIPKIPLFIMLLGGIYSLYFYYPSKKRIHFDRNLLNIGSADEKNK